MNTWLLICNEKKYNIAGAYNKFKRIDWRQVPQLSKAAVEDTAYIYVSAPTMAIRYKAVITKVNLNECEINDSEFCSDLTPYGRYMEIKFIKEYQLSEKLSRKALSDNGINKQNPMAGPILLNEETVKYLDSID